jgi:molecular chaperone GrpE (heat shock protein)
LIFESNEVKDSELLFDYQNINDEVSDINDRIKINNKIIFALESETDGKIEEEFKKESKKLDTDLKDAKKKVDDIAKGLSQERLENAADKIKDLQRIFLITFSSKELEDQIPEHLKSEARAAAPDFLAVIDIIRNYINSQEHETTPLPEKLLRIFDELETAIEQLKQEDSQSSIGSIQDMISKSIFFPDKRTLARPAKNKPVSEPATSKSSV